MRLSDHFTLQELCKSQTALRLGISNQPTKDHIESLRHLCETVLEPIRLEYGPFTPSSGYRSKELNQKIGGSRRSQHSKGEAADIEVPGVSNKELAEFIFDSLNYDQLILEYWSEENDDPNNGWVHVSTIRQACRKQCLSYDGHTYQNLLL